jgi:hypothetical protein
MSYWAELLLTVLVMVALMIVVVSIADAIAAELPERWDHLGHEAIEERAPVLGHEVLRRCHRWPKQIATALFQARTISRRHIDVGV